MAASPDSLQDAVFHAFLDSCLTELKALKPGNVHQYADGHDMTVADFVKSAEAAAPVMADPTLTVGERILKSVEATHAAVGCNTNLGIILLCAPLVQGVLTGEPSAPLETRLKDQLAALTVEDAAHAFRAIRLASPAGLGERGAHDVHDEPDITLLDAMKEAQSFDRIAYQYAHGFEDVFALGVPCIRESLAKGLSEEWAAAIVYMKFLSRINDTHIERKYSKSIADAVRNDASNYEKALQTAFDPAQMHETLMAFDRKLKAQKINPGTSADLTVAGLLAVKLTDIVAPSIS